MNTDTTGILTFDPAVIFAPFWFQFVYLCSQLATDFNFLSALKKTIYLIPLLLELFKELASRGKFAKPALAYGLAMGGQTDSQVGSQVHASHKKS